MSLGFTRRQIERRIEAGRLVPIHRGVYLVGPIRQPLATEMAAVLACGRSAFSSNASAGHVWAFLSHMQKPDRPEVTVVSRDPGLKPGIRIHRVTELHPSETTTRRNIPITTPARTLLDLAPTLTSRQVEQALAQAIRQHRVRLAQLTTLLARRSSRPGASKLRRLVEEPPAFTRSGLEERFLALVRDAGLPQPELNAELGPYEIDALWRDHRLAVELDSWDWHSERKAFEDHRRRDADLVARGYRVIRITWRQLRDEPLAVAARLAAALADQPPVSADG